MLVAAAQSGTQNSASETHFRIRRPRPVVPAELTPQTISFRVNALNSRGIVGAGNPGRFARTGWWWTQSWETGLRRPNSLLAGKEQGIFCVSGFSLNLGRS